MIDGTTFKKGQGRTGAKDIQIKLLQKNDEVDGKRISDWIADWWNWTISDRIDASQNEEVMYFLRILSKLDESSSARGAESVREITVLEGKPILFPILNTMIDSGTFPAEDTHSKRISACKNENNASPLRSIRCTIDGNEVLGGRNIREVRMESDQFTLDATTQPPLVRLDYDTPSGTWPAATEGYWICMKGLKAHNEPYILRIQSQGVDGYFVNIIYRIHIAENINDEFDLRLLPQITDMIKKGTMTDREADIGAPGTSKRRI